jgi:hypothetical protein
MKKLLLLTLLSSLFLFGYNPVLKAQPYKSIFGNNSTIWTVSFEQGDWYGSDSLKLVSDTIINSMNYKTVQDYCYYHSAAVRKFYIREDTINGKYYIRNNVDIDNEYLFMDLGLNVGDTFFIHQNSYFFPDSLAIVNSISYINNLKVITTNLSIRYLSTQSSTFLTFIESIGPNNGINYLFQNHYADKAYGLVCHFKDDTLFYHNNDAWESRPCFLEGGGFVKEFCSIIKSIYPNPTNSLLNIELSKMYTGNILLYNIYGQLVYEGKVDSIMNHVINVNDLEPGYYFLKLFSNRTKYQVGFIKL